MAFSMTWNRSVSYFIQATSQPIQMRMGQIYLATIKKIYPQQQLALVELAGRTLVAQVHLPLVQGEKSWLMVEKGGAPPILKVLTEPVSPSAGGVRPLPPSSTRLLQYYGLRPTSKLVQILDGLQGEKLPVDLPQLKQLAQALPQLPRIPLRQLQTVVASALLRQLPLTSTTIRSIHQVLFGVSWGELCQDWITLYEAGANRMVQGNEAQQIYELLQRGRISTSSLREGLAQLGLSYERQLKESIQQGGDGGQVGPVLGLKQRLLQLLQRMEATHPLRQRSEALIAHLTGQQLLTLSPSQQGLQQFTLPLPWVALLANNHAWVQLEGKMTEKGELDPENCHLLFYLEMPASGINMVDVLIVKGLLSVHLYYEDVRMAQWMEAERPRWEEGLEAFGYHLSNLRFSPLSEQEHGVIPVAGGHRERKKGSGGTKRMMRPYQGLDVRI